MNRKSSETAEKILQAGMQLFPEKGYHGTTVQMISEDAEVNIAAVNYHFGGKDELYMLVWERVFTIKEKRFKQVFSEDKTPEQKLKEYIEMRIDSTFCTENHLCLGKLIHWESSNPTHLFPEIKEKYLSRLKERFKCHIREFLGDEADDPVVHSAMFAIQSCLRHLVEIRKERSAMLKDEIFDDKFCGIMKKALYDFSIGGLKNLRSRIDEGAYS